MLPPTLHIQNASFTYHNKLTFSKVNLTLEPTQWIGLLGPSGVGKSTLLKLVAGLLPLANDTSITATNAQPVASQIAYMAQTDLLLPWLNVMDNVLLSTRLHAYPHAYVAEKREQALRLLSAVGLKNVTHFYPHALSGGMRQRVALVRTLIVDKPIILMDEPFSALDAISRYKLQALAAEILKDKSVLFITHDPQEALRLADKIYLLQGHPATLREVAALSTTKPREFNDPEIIVLQTSLYQELANESEVPL